MRKTTLSTLVGVLCAVVGLFDFACASSSGGAQSGFIPITSTFDSDHEQWGIVGDAHGQGAVPKWQAAGGNSGGYIEATDDVTGGTWYWSAPHKFLKSGSLLGKTLSFDLKVSAVTDPFDDGDIVAVGRSLRIVAKLPAPPKTAWTHYEVPLTLVTGWRLEKLDGKLANWIQISMVFSDLQGLYIRGEYETGPDTGGLDNVVVR